MGKQDKKLPRRTGKKELRKCSISTHRTSIFNGKGLKQADFVEVRAFGDTVPVFTGRDEPMTAERAMVLNKVMHNLLLIGA